MGLAFAAAVVLPVAVAALAEPGYLTTVRHYSEGMARDRAERFLGWRDLGFFLAWIVALGPAAVAAATAGWTRHRRQLLRPRTILLAVSVPSLVHLLLLGTFHDISFSPRYLLPVLPGAVALPAAIAAAAWIRQSRVRLAAALALLLLPLVVAAPIVRAREAPLDAILDELPSRLRTLPPRSLIVTGQPCTTVALVREQMRREAVVASSSHDWGTVCPGWGWPEDLTARLDAARAAGQTVVLDLRSAAWLGAEQRRSLVEAEAYRRLHADDGRKELIIWE